MINDFEVTSVYRALALNRCAGGADASRHVFNAALDFRIGPEQPSDLDQFNIQQTKTKLCQFWATKGQAFNMDWVFMLQDKSILIVKVLEHGARPSL